MNSPSPFPPNQNSKSLAFLFLLIALIGIMLAFRNPSRSKAERPVPFLPDTSAITVTAPASQSENSLSGYILRTALVLGLLAGVLYWGLRFYRRKVQTQAGGSGQIKVVGKYYFNPKQYLAAVIWNEREMLLGVTEQQFTKLAEIDLSAEEENFSDRIEQSKSGSPHA